jgi:hypothetical protein
VVRDTLERCKADSLRVLGSRFLGFLADAADWVRRHEPELRALGTWSAVGYAGRKARLYVPMHREAWLQLGDARRNQEPGAEPDFEAMIVSLYGPGGVAFDALREELLGPSCSPTGREKSTRCSPVS